MGASEDLSGVQLTNGTRPGNTAFAQTPEGQDATDDSGVVYEEPEKEEPLTPDGCHRQ